MIALMMEAASTSKAAIPKLFVRDPTFQNSSA
jgi:hypothetical protein